MRAGTLRAFSVLLVAALLAGRWGAAGTPALEPWSWQEAHARVTPEGDLEWAPQPFAFKAGDSVRYIDFEGGDDANPGTRQAPWKHHPWDPAATGRAAACGGIQTYVFKRGVAYHGTLAADDSGEPGNPIRLTSDPTWGEGEAAIHGSLKIEGGWRRCGPGDAPADMPEPEKVWHADIGTEFVPRALWMVDGGRIARIPIARDPNWEVTNPDDVKSEWHEWQNVEKETIEVEGREQVKAFGIDVEHLTARDPGAYVGGTVWTEYSGVMGTPYANPIEAYDPQRHAIRFGGPWGDASSYAPIVHCRYFIENLPLLLDAPGEYYYAAGGPHAGRLYVRLPEDRDPNAVALEAARDLTLVDIRGRSHIHVTGLTFRFQNVVHWYDRWWPIPDVDPACVRVLGSCEDIRVSNCRFEHVVMAVRAVADGLMDGIAITDNEILHTDYGAIDLAHGGGREESGGELRRVEVLRNRLYDIGLRPMRAHHGHALVVSFATLPEIAGNVLDRCYGAGLFIFGGKGGGELFEQPLSRVLIHHNKVTDPLLNTNDWGGVEFWQGGPAYIYNNVSGNPGGYWHWKHVFGGSDPEKRDHATARFGHAYYLDGGFKAYVFNNIAWGKSNDLTSPLCNACALQEVIGFLNSAFNNTFYKFGAGGRRHSPEAGRNCYLGNLWMDISDICFRHADIDRPEDANLAREGGQSYAVDTLAYADNVFHGAPRHFGCFDVTAFHKTLGEFRDALAAFQPLASQTGWQAEQPPVRDAEAHDFRPTPGSAVIDRGVEFFVPWGLYGVVGEWHFYKHPADPSQILGEHWYMTDEYVDRGMYRFIPRHDLTAHNVGADDFVAGPLEDWTQGALALNGRDQYCVLPDADLKSDYEWGRRNRVSTYPGGRRKTPDMGTNNFLIEVVLRTEPGRAGGVIVSKADDAGYVLDVDGTGRARLTLKWPGGGCARSGSAVIYDAEWHHVIAEVDRSAPEGIALYVDGARADGPWSGAMPPAETSLANTADFLVGKGAGGDYLAGALDFLRVARGTLADAETTIEELYDWQFNGPFLRDFLGEAPADGRRDAGAIECRTGALQADRPVAGLSERPSQWAVPIERQGLPNLHRVSDDLYRGAQPTADGFRELKEMGIRTVVNLRSLHSDRDEVAEAGLAYEHIAMKAWHPEDEDAVRFLRIVTDPAKTPVFVHCQHGADRTGIVCAAYRMAVQGWSPEEAVAEMTEGGFGFHRIWEDLRDYVRELDVAKIRRRAGLAEVNAAPELAVPRA